MVFYQTTTNTLTSQILKNAIFKNTLEPKLLTFHCRSLPNIKNLDNFMHAVEQKRKTLSNPIQHNFLCIEVFHNNPMADSDARDCVDTIADALYDFYNQDIFICSIVYQDDFKQDHAIVLISDIEKSLTKSSSEILSIDTLRQNLNYELNGLHISQLLYDALYLFHGDKTELAYDGIIHYRCDVEC